VTRNAAIDRFRRTSRRSSRLADPRAHPDGAMNAPDDPSAGADQRHIGNVVEAFFHELPDRQREVFDLAELQGVPAAEIADRLGIEAVSVRAHLFKARRTLRTRILESHPELAEEWT
jgi:RNA polymerase sigma-70 factor (ECF subfamily)